MGCDKNWNETQRKTEHGTKWKIWIIAVISGTPEIQVLISCGDRLVTVNNRDANANNKEAWGTVVPAWRQSRVITYSTIHRYILSGSSWVHALSVSHVTCVSWPRPINDKMTRKDSTSSLILQQRSWTKFVAARGLFVAANRTYMPMTGNRSCFVWIEYKKLRRVSWNPVSMCRGRHHCITTFDPDKNRDVSSPLRCKRFWVYYQFCTRGSDFLSVACTRSHWHWRSHLSRNSDTSLYLHHTFFGRPVCSRTHRLPV